MYVTDINNVGSQIDLVAPVSSKHIRIFESSFPLTHKLAPLLIIDTETMSVEALKVLARASLRLLRLAALSFPAAVYTVAHFR